MGDHCPVQTGLMNHPARPIADQLRSIAAEGHAFVDLTLEPPAAWPVDVDAVRALLAETGLGVVGHTAHYLPIGSPFERVRLAAVDELVAALDAFAALGARWMNVHPDRGPRLVDDAESRARCADSLGRLADAAAARGVGLMVENLSPPMATADQMRAYLDAAPGIGLHLDVGHAHLRGSNLAGLLDAFGDRLAHLHVHDNTGYRDEHLPLGAGKVDWPAAAAAIRATGYDETVTLEVFAEEPELVRTSVRLWRQWWEAAAPA
jgi:sugar phosphate isomerase/epimerase